MDDITSAWPTVPDDPSSPWDRFERGLRALALVVAIGVVALAVTGVTGVHDATDSVSNDQIRVDVRHASVSRPGLATPFSVTIVPAGDRPFPTTLNIRVPTDFLAMFDENGLHPTPDSESSDGNQRTWTYELPASTSQLTVEYDARLQPNTHWGGDATVSVDGELARGEPLDAVDVSFTMRVFP